MNRTGRALTESCLLHGLLAGGLLFLGGLLSPAPEIIRLDFSLQPQALAPVAPAPEPSAPAPVPPAVKAPAVARKPPVVRPAAANPRPRPPAPTPTQGSPDQARPAVEAAANDSAPADQARGNGAAGAAPAKVAGGGEAGATGEAYRRTHFIAIRDAILAQLRYPLIARRQGLSGQVEVAFLIAPDGSVSELRIRSSSGHAVLDEQALAAIRRAAPFAPPRLAALLVMPVTFQLN